MLNQQQFAKYSATLGHDDFDVTPLPASMERHAPGEYQPTLPGMEKMLPNEVTHTSVFFKHPNVVDQESGDVPGSAWWNISRNYHPKQVQARVTSLRPSQDWMNENYLHDPIHPRTLQAQGVRPKVENIQGKNVIQDGHHRAARAIISGAKTVGIDQWGGK